MARKATPTSGRKRSAAKPKTAAARKSTATRKSTSAAKTAARKPTRAKAATPRRAASSSRSSSRSTQMTAADALQKLIESPLVADLLAVGATAALAAIAGRGLSRSGGTGSTVKAAGKAAAAAMGKRLSTEVEEIRTSSRARDAARE
jgi:hypothetical protein